MTTKTVNLYEFVELSDKAKNKAREWWRECEAQEFGAHGDLTEFAETAAKLLGITFKTRPVRLMSGKDRYDPCIYWQLHVQGAGASFEGSYAYAKGAVKAIAGEFGTDAELERIARELQGIQKRNGYRMTATITQGAGCGGHYVHAGTMDIEHDWMASQRVNDDYAMVLELMRDFARWIYKGIEGEYDYRMSDENVDDAITCNGYTFTGDGERED